MTAPRPAETITEPQTEAGRRLAWRMTMIGVVLHAVWSNGTNRASGRALCGVESADGIWHYASGRYTLGAVHDRCLRCRQASERLL